MRHLLMSHLMLETQILVELEHGHWRIIVDNKKSLLWVEFHWIQNSTLWDWEIRIFVIDTFHLMFIHQPQKRMNLTRTTTFARRARILGATWIFSFNNCPGAKHFRDEAAMESEIWNHFFISCAKKHICHVSGKFRHFASILIIQMSHVFDTETQMIHDDSGYLTLRSLQNTLKNVNSCSNISWIWGSKKLGSKHITLCKHQEFE